MSALQARAVAFVLASWAAGCASAPQAEPPVAARPGPLPVPAARVVALPNGGFEEAAREDERCAARWQCSMHADPNSFEFTLERGGAPEGSQAMCIRRVSPEPWAIITQALEAESLQNKRVRVSVAVRVEAADGAGVGPWVLLTARQGEAVHVERPVARTRGWERIAVEALVPPGALAIQLGATMQGGGRACIDDVRLEVLP